MIKIYKTTFSLFDEEAELKRIQTVFAGKIQKDLLLKLKAFLSEQWETLNDLWENLGYDEKYECPQQAFIHPVITNTIYHTLSETKIKLEVV